MTQGDALGYRILPRWGNSARRFPQIVMRGSIAGNFRKGKISMNDYILKSSPR